jgi:hypothetical protein
MKIVATYVYASSQGQHKHSARTKMILKIEDDLNKTTTKKQPKKNNKLGLNCAKLSSSWD